MLRELFQVRSAKLRAALWQVYPKSTALVYTLARCGELAPTPQIAAQRIKHLSQALEPRYLLMAAEKIAPAGRVRPVELHRFEEKVLAIIDRDGHWLWH